MKKLNNNQQGFSLVEAILVVVLAVLIGVIGWFVFKNHHKTTTTKSSSVSNVQPSSQSNTYTGWKTYSWTAEGLTFKYPSSWVTINPQVSPALQSGQQATKPSDPFVYLFSPNIVTETGFDAGSTPNMSDTFTGDFAINATKDTASNITTSLDAGPRNGTSAFVYILKVIPFTVPGYKQLYIVEEGEQSSSYADELAITDVPVKVGLTTTTSDDSYQSKTTPVDRISFTIGLFSEAKDSPENFAFINMNANTFEQLQDYNTAKLILESIQY